MRQFWKALILLPLLACAGSPQPVLAQSSLNGIAKAYVCDASTNSGQNCLKPAADGSIAVSGATASITGFPTSQSTGTPISVTTSSTTGTLPTGVVVVATNAGATNNAYCKLGATATTSDQLIAPNSWFAFTVGGSTQLSCITSTSTTTVNMVGGSGIPTGAGGGGGGSGGGGVVTNAGTFAVQAAQSGTWTVQPGNTANTTAWKVDGSAVTQPISVASIPSHAVTNAGTFAVQNNAATPTGTNVIGKVSIDQTTPGTTNAVQVTNNGSAIDATTAGQTPSTVACNTLSATPTAGTTAHTNPITCDLYGNLITIPYSLAANRVQGAITTAMTGTTTTSLLAAPGASLFNYITSISCKNSHATVGTLIAVQDGSGGTTMFTLAAAALFGGDNKTFLSPWKQTTANTALFVANVTTGASTTCDAEGYKGP